MTDRLIMVEYLGEAARGRGFTAMDLTDPELRFDRMAESMGVPGFRVDKPDDLGPALRKALDHDGPLAGRRRHGEPGPDPMTRCSGSAGSHDGPAFERPASM